MPNIDPNKVLKSLQKFSSREKNLKLYAQSHARAILRGLKTPESEWPAFQEDLDIRLYYGAHYQIWKALQLLEVEQYQKQAKEFLTRGAETLEFLFQDQESDPLVRDEEVFKAIVAYYISGHYARSYVLMKESASTLKNLPKHLDLILAVLKKDFKKALFILAETFDKQFFTDEIVSDELLKEVTEDNEAIIRIIYSSACRAISFYLEYVKTGEQNFLIKAFSILNDSIILARESKFVDWWWWLYCLKFLFEEYNKSNLWTQLQSFNPDEASSFIIQKYIRYGLRQKPPLIELWPSQVQAITMVNDDDRRHFCLKMPTSSGKTLIAELTILRFFLDKLNHPDSKCVYIAPFRSLAAEIEKTLQNGLFHLGIKVSEIYGGFEISPGERALIQETKIIVATPEKFDALLRFMPEIEDNIGLIIIDEGHIVDPNERGLRFEFFLHRLLHKYKEKDCRFLFISAVLPNAKEFSEWITGSPEQLIQSDWRPSRLMLGKLSWSGKRARIDYTHIGRIDFGQDCFVPGFIVTTEIKGLPGVGGRRSPFPKDAKEAFALAALLFAQDGTTLVFVPQKKQAEPFGRVLLEANKIQKILLHIAGKEFKIPFSKKAKDTRIKCKQIIKEEMGTDSSLINFLDNGFIIHHADLPQRVRAAIEDMVRADGIRLIVATTTLAQGVNLPIKTVLVRGLQHGYRTSVNPLSFWNICGRAGRAGKENEGQVLFCVDQTVPSSRRKRYEKAIKEVIDTLEQKIVISATRLVLRLIVKQWQEMHPQVDIEALCEHLANNSYEWVSETSRDKIRYWIDILDGHLLALSEEFDIDAATPDRLQEVLEGSLLFIQLNSDPSAIISTDIASALLRSRINYIHHAYPQASVRKRLYKLGMALSDCETIETNKEELYSLFSEASSWSDRTDEEKFNLLLRISEFVLTLKEIKPKVIPDQWPTILSYWLEGKSAIEMIENNEINKFTRDSTNLSLLLEDICGYRLPWGVNSILSYLIKYAEEKSETLPLICSYFSGMFKYGVNDPIALCILPYLGRARKLALIISNACPYDIKYPNKIIAWFKLLDEKDLAEYGINNFTAKKIINIRDSLFNIEFEKGPKERRSIINIKLKNKEKAKGIKKEDKVLVIPRSDISKSCFQIITLDGKVLGLYKKKNLVPTWWFDLHLVDSTIIDIQKQDKDYYKLSIKVEEL